MLTQVRSSKMLPSGAWVISQPPLGWYYSALKKERSLISFYLIDEKSLAIDSKVIFQHRDYTSCLFPIYMADLSSKNIKLACWDLIFTYCRRECKLIVCWWWTHSFFFFLIFYFILGYSRLIVSGEQQRDSAVSIYTFPFSPRLPSHPGCLITLNRVPCAIQ